MSVRAVIVIESCFGNTAAIADAVSGGLRRAGVTVDVMTAQDAPARMTADLVLVGAPTHSFGLSSPATRAKAAALGANAPQRGVREWIDGVEAVDGHVIAFSTVTGRFSGSAAAAAAKALRRHGVDVDRGPDFRVTDTRGPLADGELVRAESWGAQLATDH